MPMLSSSYSWSRAELSCTDLGILAVQEFMSVDEAVLYHVLLAANYLNIKSLL